MTYHLSAFHPAVGRATIAVGPISHVVKIGREAQQTGWCNLELHQSIKVRIDDVIKAPAWQAGAKVAA